MSTVLHQQRRFTNYDFGFQIRRTVRLCRALEILEASQVTDPLPTRRNLVDLLEEGIIEGKLSRYGWLVYEDSFLNWIRNFNA